MLFGNLYILNERFCKLLTSILLSQNIAGLIQISLLNCYELPPSEMTLRIFWDKNMYWLRPSACVIKICRYMEIFSALNTDKNKIVFQIPSPYPCRLRTEHINNSTGLAERSLREMVP